MTPIDITTYSDATQVYGSPFVGPIDHTAPVRVDPSNLFDGVAGGWLDERGWLKPGTPLTQAGALADGAADVAYGLVIEPLQILRLERGAAVTQAALDALGDRQVIVATICQVNQDLLEDIKGAALTADEASAIDDAKTIIRIR